MRSMAHGVLAGLLAFGVGSSVDQISTASAGAPAQGLLIKVGKQEPRGPRLTDLKTKLAEQVAEKDLAVEAAEANKCGTPQAFEEQTVTQEVALAKAGFAMDLITRLSSKNQNVSVSPFGLSAVLSALDLGADPALHEAIAATMHLSPGADKLDELRRESRLINLAIQRDPRRISSFNAVFVDHRLPLKPGIRDLAVADVDVDVQSIDFESQFGIDGLNDLLTKKTNGRIKSILEPGSAPTLVAINALFFNDCWKTPFDKSRTADRPFTRPDGTKAERSTMSGAVGSAGYRTAGPFVAVELSYLDENFALTLVTTQHAPAKAADFKEAVSLLAGVDFLDTKATLSLPKFGGQTDNDLLDTLSAMGLKPGLASANQLPGFSNGLKIGRVRQKTWLAVDEAGTELAAVTAVEATRAAPRPKAVSVSFDKPFIYALRYRPTGTILMAGYVGDPDSGPHPAATETPPASDEHSTAPDKT